MAKYSWAMQREEVQLCMDEWFGRAIDIAPRALASFQVGGHPVTRQERLIYHFEPEVFEHDVLGGLLRSSPASATFLFKAGVKMESLDLPMGTEHPAPLGGSTLDWIFNGVECEELGETPTAQKIRRSGLLNELDILVSALEASLRGQEPNEFGGLILKASGHPTPGTRRWVRTHKDFTPDPGWGDCDRYLKRVLSDVKYLATADPSHSMVQFVLYEDERRIIRVRPFGVTELSRLALRGPLVDEARYLYRGGVLQPIETINPELPAHVLSLFEELLNSPATSEHDLQAFLETYPWLLMGLDFGTAHPQPILYMDEGKSLIPDFFLERLSSGWDSIVDLKRPFEDMVIRRQNRTYFAQHVQNAIAQLRYYREWFDSASNRKQFQERYGITTFRPKMVIVMGRRHHFRDDVERIRLMESLPQHVDLWTYDDLMDRARKYLQIAAGVRSSKSRHNKRSQAAQRSLKP